MSEVRRTTYTKKPTSAECDDCRWFGEANSVVSSDLADEADLDRRVTTFRHRLRQMRIHLAQDVIMEPKNEKTREKVLRRVISSAPAMPRLPDNSGKRQ